MARSDRLLLSVGACLLALAVLGAWLVLGPSGEPVADASLLVDPEASSQTAAAPSPSASPSVVIVDVEGAVLEPGLQSLPGGSRLADAISAAGGYGAQVDLQAAARELNLATELADGQQVYVPRLGDSPAAASSPAAAGGAGGLVDLNSATPEELDALPGIGPVTVQKIVAARQERPFSSLDDAVERGVLNNGQLEKIRDQATAG